MNVNLDVLHHLNPQVATNVWSIVIRTIILSIGHKWKPCTVGPLPLDDCH